jgi:thiosulfate dehydrogenase [quinone] large subunit
MTADRRYATISAAIAVVALFFLYDPWIVPPDSISPFLTVIFWIATIVVFGLLFMERSNPEMTVVEVEGPAFARFLFNSTQAGLFWLAIRVFVGFEWLEAGWEKLSGNGWINDGGSSLLGFWKSAVAIPQTGRPPVTFEWYRTFLQTLIDNHAETWFAWMIAFGETAVGVGILLGALTGIAAFFGATMNMSYMLAGSASTNPILFAFNIGLILAWRVAGYYGLDRWLLPRLGVPWTRRLITTQPLEAPPGPTAG